MAKEAEAMATRPTTKRPHELLREMLSTCGGQQRRLPCPSGPSDPMNEVYPHVFIGNEKAARDIDEISRCGITHVLNAAKGTRPYQHVNIDPALYENQGIKYLAIEATDTMGFRLNQYFEQASDFMEHSLSNNGKILVHCKEGVSRSATLVLAFLISRRNMSAAEAIQMVLKSRAIFPNPGFLKQLCNFEEDIQQEQHSENGDCHSQLPVGNA